MIKRALIYLSAACIFAACSKDDAPPAPQDIKSTIISDMPGDTLASMGTGVDGKEKRPFYGVTFSFSTRQTRIIKTAADSAQYLKNADWDIAFTKEYNSYVVANNGTVAGTPGYGGPGVGRMVIIEAPYDQVHAAPADEEFERNGVAGVGWDSGSGYGWYFYSLNNHIAVPIKNRTFIVKTADGRFAKLALLNIYKGNPPVVTDLFWPAPYLTFKYFVQENGSRDLKTN
ncbi:HmuY family protein [Chitinophaga sp.]|uniref:HmuY family protein n=1 Tax=Chitinophaga sp. TaxID=1869181 RepID=UPI0031D8369D